MVKEMKKFPEKSDIEIFHSLADGLTKIQKKLDQSYRNQIFLRDQLFIAADLHILKR